MALFAVDGRDLTAQRVNPDYDGADGVRFHKIEASSAAEAITEGRRRTEEARLRAAELARFQLRRKLGWA